MPLHIQSLDHSPIHELTYQHAEPNVVVITAQLPISIVRTSGLPPGVDAIVCTSDLQGIEPLWTTESPRRLVGELLADELALLSAVGAIPPLERTGVVLAGDLYSAPGANQLGVSGDVRSVWAAFHRRFRWVTGISGNHDQFGTAAEFAAFHQREGQFYINGTNCTIDTLTIAGIGGIIGNPRKPQRRAPEQYEAVFKHVLQSQPDLLVVHESPALPEQRGRGSPVIRTLIDTFTCPLTVSGHSRWQEPFTELPNGTQLLNVDSRVVVLMRQMRRNASSTARPTSYGSSCQGPLQDFLFISSRCHSLSFPFVPCATRRMPRGSRPPQTPLRVSRLS